ncbi:MAG: hypothetical protein JOZ33_01570 [Acidobacteriaceae bacterium]|nr:hypothetical protein [Acidobacteriaceae bacterium]
MSTFMKTLAAVALGTVLATSAFAQSASETPSHSPLVPEKNEPAPTLTLGQPVAEALARGALVVPYRVENIRILPILGPAAGDVSPRVGHLHVSIDDLPWHWADFSENAQTIVVVGLPAGQHKLTVGVASVANHHVFVEQTVTFTIPETAPHSH